ncbi:MAG: STAS domain-containing protein, partial [Burkholderiales bacterium]|nr:STAS domain-containing protein [Burkholderiales bacterium]
MAENESFFRKVVRFVANPATDWTDLSARQEDNRDLEIEKSELKAMIERKRRNDFVRKREFDMLRKVRREGLSPEQLAALGGLSRLDDSEARLIDTNTARPDGVKQKIDEIEQQMVGDGIASGVRRPPPPPPRSRPGSFSTTPISPLPPAQPLPPRELAPPSQPAPMQMAGGLPPLAPLNEASIGEPANPGAADFGRPFAVEVSEVQHDPELDEPVIAFANADFSQCEQALREMTSPGGSRAQHAETWLVLFDLYRATGQQPNFESLALEYAHQFGWSAPQWYSLPKLVADAVAEDEPRMATSSSASRLMGEVGWVCPDMLDIDAVGRLRSLTLQMPLPWIFDWGGLHSIDAEAAMQLSMLFRLWAGQALEMRWVAGDRLFSVLSEAAPTGVRDADPAFWLTRLDALRLANRADQFDEAAIDYCVTYEVSPPSWEPARCKVHVSGASMSTRQPSMSVMSGVSTSFHESTLSDDPGGQIEQAHVELSGQLVGDISATLATLDSQLGASTIVDVSCARLIRVDFIAAGDLLNWVLAKRSQNRSVQFTDAHRLVALFFGAMGINEHARVQVRKV